MSNGIVYPVISDIMLNAFKINVQSMSAQDKLCAVIFDEMSIKESVHYTIEREETEGYEDFGDHGKSKYIANHCCHGQGFNNQMEIANRIFCVKWCNQI
jgi:hypothetical protein